VINLAALLPSVVAGTSIEFQSLDELEGFIIFDDLNLLFPNGVKISCVAGECGDQQFSTFDIPAKRTGLSPTEIAGTTVGLWIVFTLLASFIVCLVMQKKQRKMPPVTPCKGLTLSFSGIGYQVSRKQILEKIDGVAHPGRVLAILGPSGMLYDSITLSRCW
jgi:hypothetical protein